MAAHIPGTFQGNVQKVSLCVDLSSDLYSNLVILVFLLKFCHTRFCTHSHFVIPIIIDDGNVLIVYAPHVGVATTGGVGKVERRGIELLDNCCGSAIAASNYVQSVTDGGAGISTNIKQFSDFQQSAVQELLLPHGKRLADAEDRMKELPFCIYDSQDLLMQDIVKGGASRVKNNIALLGGIQINTAPESLDYFLPLRFDYMNNQGEVVEDMLDEITF